MCSSNGLKINGDLQEVGATAKVVHNVELSKSQSGVTAKILGSNYTLSVFFDGNTAQIHLMGMNRKKDKDLRVYQLWPLDVDTDQFSDTKTKILNSQTDRTFLLKPDNTGK